MSMPPVNPGVPPTLRLQSNNNSHPTSDVGSAPISQGSQRSSVGSSNGQSYVVLGSSSTGNRASNDFSMVNHVGTGSPSSLADITLEQALDKVQELAQENASLREYLKENNENMKKQFNMLVQWKTKVRESNQTNLRKFEEVKAKLERLTTENQRLKDNQASHRLPPDQQNPNAPLTEDLQERVQKLTEETNMKAQKVNELKQKIQELEMQLNNKSPEKDTVFVGKTEAVEAVDQLEEANQELQSRCDQLESKVRNFHQQNEQLMVDLQHVQHLKQDIQSENSNLTQENLELQKRVQSLLGDIKQTKHSVGGVPINGEGARTYGYSMAGEEQGETEVEAQTSVTAQQDLEILGLQTAAANRSEAHERSLADFSMSEITADLRVKLQEERNVTSQQKQAICNRDAKIARLETELTETRQMLNHYKQQLDTQVAAVTQEHQRQEQQLVRQLDCLNTELQHAKLSMSPSADVQSLKSQVMTLINEIQEAAAKQDATSRALENKSARLVELEQHIHRQGDEMQKQRAEGDALIQSLRSSLTTYEEALGRERNEHVTTKKQLGELRASFNVLVGDYKELLDTFDDYKAQQLQQQQQQGSQVSKQAMDEINRLTAQTIAAEEAITYRDDHIKQLKLENAKLKDELETTVPVLRAQADVWKQDFDAERQARERQHTEKEKILQDMKNLEIQNQQLLDEIESYSRRSLVEMQRRHAPGTYQQQVQSQLGVGGQPIQPQLGVGGQGSPTAGYQFPLQADGYQQFPDQVPPMEFPKHGDLSPRQPPNKPPSQTGSNSQTEEGEHLMSCPKCGMVCPDLDTLQIHVIDCIDN